MKWLGVIGAMATVVLAAWALFDRSGVSRRADTSPVVPSVAVEVPLAPAQSRAPEAASEPPTVDEDPDGLVDAQGESEERAVDLIVVDARNGNPIADALAHEYAGDYDFEPGARLPGPATLRREPRHADSGGRLRLAKGRDCARLYLFAEGYAWRAVEVPWDAGAEVVVDLETGGDAYLLIPRFQELRAPQIWVRRPIQEWIRAPLPPSGTDEVLVRGLVPGDYEIRICRGEWFESGTIYGTGTGTIVAGKTRNITIAVTPEPAQAMVTVTGTVTVPAGWKHPPDWITFEGAEESNADISETVFFGGRGADEEARGAVCFKTDALPAGRYLAKIDPYQWAKHVVVSDRSTRFDFDVPRAVNVRVRVVDGKQVDVRGATVRWCTPLAGRIGWPASSEDGMHVFQAPPGMVTVGADAPGFVVVEEQFDVQEDRELTLTLARGATAIVRLRIDGKPFDGTVARVELRGPGLWREQGFYAGAATFDGLPPGKWTLTLGDVAGCAAVAPQGIEVAAGETREVWFDLKMEGPIAWARRPATARPA